MITMEMLGKVKRLYSRDKKSLHEIAKTTGLSRNTIRKWVRGTDEVDKPTYRRKETANKHPAALRLASTPLEIVYRFWFVIRQARLSVFV